MAMANVVAAAVAAAAEGGADTGGGDVAGGASKANGDSQNGAREYSVDISDSALGLRLRLRPPGKRAGSARVHDLAQVSAVRRAGVKRGDVLLEVNGSSMRGLRDMSKAVEAIKTCGRPLTLKFRRPREGADPDESDDEGDATADDDGDKDPPLKDDPVYSKYWKMLKVGLPLGAVMNACERDSVDPTVMELDPNKSLASQRKKEEDKTKAEEEEEEADIGPPLSDDPTYGKYFKMLKVGLPVGAVKNALARDGLDQGIIDLDPEKSLASQQKKDKKKKDTGPPLKDDPTYEKYFKMLKVGLPIGAVKNALSRDGLDSGIMDLDPERSLASQKDGGDADDEEEVDTGPLLKDDPTYAKYFKMLKVGLPIGAVKNACSRDNVDPSIMDLDPEKSLKSQQGKSSSAASVKKKEKKPKVRRKKLYWTPIDEKKIEKDSLWSIVRGSINMSQLKYDASEFEDLFTDKLEKKKIKSPTAGGAAGGGGGGGGPKKSVQVIDGKRGMNGGIILSRIKMEYSEIAELVNMMENRKKFDNTQLKALQEFLPTDEEAQALKGYLAKATSSEEIKAKAMADLCACEQYMVAMLDVPNAAAKFDCMLFKTLFQSRLNEIMDEIVKLNDASEEVRSSERLRKVMAIILTVGNQINTGGEGNSQAAGFSLDALLKLEEAKAFDKRTSVLFYLVKLIKENDEGLLKFTEDIPTVPEVNGQMIDSLFGDLKQLSKELEEVQKTADVEADRLKDENGKFINYSRKKSLSELQAQKTNVHKNDEGVEQFNIMESEEEVTDMQFFAMNAEKSMGESYATAEEMKSNYLALLRYFGEDEKMPSGDFFATLNRFLESFDSAFDAVDKADQARIKEEKRQKAKEMKDKMRSTMKKGAAAIQQATKNPPSLQNILKKRNATGSGENNNEGGEETTSKPTLAGAAAAALAKTKNKARESMIQLQKSGSKDEISADPKDKDNSAQNPRLALMNSLRKRTPTPLGEVSEPATTANASADPRAALLGAIRSKSKGATDDADRGEEEITFVDGPDSLSGERGETSGDDDNGGKSSPPLDPRAAMLAAIKKKKNTKGANSARGKSDAKQTNTTDDPRSALLSAIKSKKKGGGGGAGADKKNANSSELACIANRNLRSRGKGDSESQEAGGVTASPTSRDVGDVYANQVHHGDELARGLVLTKSEANLVLDNMGEDEGSVDVNADNAEEAGEKKHVRLSDSVANRMAQTDDLLEEFDKSLARLETKEAGLSKSYNNNDSDDESGDDSDVGAASGALGDLASELARAEEEMLGQTPTRATEDIDTSAVAQAAAAKALARRKQASSNGDPRAAMLAAISSRNKVGVEEEETAEASPATAKEETVAAVDPRSAMLAAISLRKKPEKEEDDETTDASPANQRKAASSPPPPRPVDPRSAMLAAISSRNKVGVEEEETAEASPATAKEETVAAFDPRSAMLAAISLHKKPKGQEDDRATELSPSTEEMESSVPAPSSLDPRSAMLAAISSRKKPENEEEETADVSAVDVEEETASAPALAPAVDPRSAMLAAISSLGKPDGEDKEETASTMAPVPAPTPLDPRTSMLAAIASRKKPDNEKEDKTRSSSVDNDTRPVAEEEPRPTSMLSGANAVDPRSSMLSAIRARQVDKSDDAKEKNESANQGGRAVLMASIQARRSPVNEVADAWAQDPRSG